QILTRSWQISICNGRHYGPGLTINCDATLHDGKLHLLSTEVRNLWTGLKLVPTLFTGDYKKELEVTSLAAENFFIRTKRTFSIDVDGDLKTTTPAEFKVAKNALKLVVHPDYEMK